MTGLGQTTAMLKQMRKGVPSSRSDARFAETTEFGPNPGGLRMLTYTPNSLVKGAALVVVLHGCTQQGETYANQAGWTKLADRAGFAVLAPEQTSTNNPNRCFNWFHPNDVTRGQGEVASIASMIARTVKVHGLDPAQIYITGLSAGGAMTMAMMATYPELFAGGAVIAGLPYASANDTMQALQAMQRASGKPAAEQGRIIQDAAPQTPRTPNLTIWHGDADHVVNVSNARAITQQWAAAKGFGDAEGETMVLGRRSRTVWSHHGAKLELNLVKGLGHGTPLATTGDEGLGAAAPFMLETGISSTFEISRFWGLGGVREPEISQFRELEAPETSQETELSTGGVGELVMGAIARHVPIDVAATIAKTLKAAGLLR